MIEVINILLILFMLVTGYAAVRVRELLGAVFLLGAYSFFFAMLLSVLNAPDVSFTEAMVGVGASTIFYILTLFHSNHFVARDSKPSHRLGALLVVSLLAVFFIWASLDLPDLGSLASAASQHVSPFYLTHAYHDSHTPNVVTAVVVDYRAFDTLIETAVIFTAGVACLFIMRGKL